MATDHFRIAIGSGEWPYGPKFYHIGCNQAIFDPAEVFFPKFALDMKASDYYPRAWSLLLRKWFENEGKVSLARLSEYVDTYDDYLKKMEEPGVTVNEAKEMKHTFKDYQQKDACRLSEVLVHDYLDRLKPRISIISTDHGRTISLTGPEQEWVLLIHYCSNPHAQFPPDGILPFPSPSSRGAHISNSLSARHGKFFHFPNPGACAHASAPILKASCVTAGVHVTGGRNVLYEIADISMPAYSRFSISIYFRFIPVIKQRH